MMKKYIIGGLIGFVLATAASANAEGVTKLIDQVVQGVFPVTVEGTSIGEAVVIDNKTYLPVREFGEAVGYTVSFTENREVVLTKNVESTTPIDPSAPQTDPTPVKTKEQIKIETDAAIETLKMRIKMVKISISSVEGDIKESPTRKDEFQKKIDEYNKLISDYEAQITALEAQQ